MIVAPFPGRPAGHGNRYCLPRLPDADGDTLTYTWTASDGKVKGSGASVTWTAPKTPGDYTVTCTVSDGRGGLGTEDIVLTVVDADPGKG